MESPTDWPQAELCSRSSMYRYQHRALRQAWSQEAKRLFCDTDGDFLVEAIAIDHRGEKTMIAVF